MKKIIRAVTVSKSVCFYKDLMNYLQGNDFEIISISSPGPELDELRKMDTKVVEISMERHISLCKDLKSLFSLIKVFSKEKPYMVHSMTPKAGQLCMIAAWLTRVPRRVHTFTGLIWPTKTGFSRKILMFTDWVTCACATHIIPEGKGVMEDLQHYITKKPMKVLGYGNVKGVDLVRFSRRMEVMAKADEIKIEGVFTFIYVGRIVGDKGINELLEAFVKLQHKYTDVRLFLVGDYEEKLDPVKPETLELIMCTPEVEAVGSKYGDDLLSYYAASDCFVLPSYREGFPNVVMEAGAMGLPSIVTDINGSREIIEEGKNGVTVPSKDAVALYKAMKTIIENKEDYAKMAANARPMIESRFEQGFVRKCLLDFYDEIM